MIDQNRPNANEETGDRRSATALEAALTIAVRDMVLRSACLTEVAGGAAEVQRMLDGIENVWLDDGGLPIHCDLHRSASPKATIVFQPGSGAHARLYFLLGALLARRGYHFLAIDRSGHGLSGGARGDCTIDEAIAVSRLVIDYARRQFALPVARRGWRSPWLDREHVHSPSSSRCAPGIVFRIACATRR